MKINYISHGQFKTGGYRHEQMLCQSLLDYFEFSQLNNHRLEKQLTNFFSHIKLLVWSFFKSNADINVVVLRTGISAMLRNWFNQRQVWIVLHNYDEQDNKSKTLKLYFKVLFFLLKKVSHQRFKIIAVSPFWCQYFKSQFQIKHVEWFPNLFDVSKYQSFKNNEKFPWIHLGQFSSKNDEQIFELAKRLSKDGYYCYFSTLNPETAAPNNGSYEIICFNGFLDYLSQVSHSLCTLALVKINEGWNRVAHESLLLNTPVIGYQKAGLGDLLKESNSICVKNIDEAYICIKEAVLMLPDEHFILKYDASRGKEYIQKICQTL